jgi:bifunctional DNase/RNase
MSDMIEVILDSVRVSLMSPQRIVILRQKDAGRYLPVWVGPYEAEAITVALQEVEMSRPLTHDLLRNVFTTFNAVIARIEIISLKEDIFYGSIIAEADGKTVAIDSRPSDAIALAVRAHVPILVSQAVLDEAGIVPERDLQEQTSLPSIDETQPLPPASKDAEDRLLVFDDFMKKLEDDKGKDKKDSEGGESDKDKPKKKPKK